MEPTCEPSRIRVPDHTSVLLTIRAISPIETCAITPKAQSITAVVNPLESIFNTITGYKNFTIDTAHKKAKMVLFTHGATAADNDLLKAFEQLNEKIPDLAQTVITKQDNAQKQYAADVVALNQYSLGDYRGNNWSNFQPATASELVQSRADSQFPKISADATTTQPSELDMAPLQAIIDQMKTLQTRLTASCTAGTASCDTNVLAETATDVDNATASLAILNDNFKSLQTQQAAVSAAYNGLVKARTDFDTRVSVGVVKMWPPKPDPADQNAKPVDPKKQILYMPVSLGRDYGTTNTGTISCTSTIMTAMATTNTINYTILYQNVPALTVSTGILTSFLREYEYGVVSKLDANSEDLTATPPDPGTFTNYFEQTENARVQVFPMAFVNYRVFKPWLKSWWAEPNSELAITTNLSGGIGVNPNTGTNQVEYFGGGAIGFSRAMVHFGEHWGRQESLGGGYTVGNPVPTGWSSSNTVPIDWTYKHHFTLGFSVRIAPF